MTATCKTQGKFMYPSQARAIKVALASSRKRGTALRVYRHTGPEGCGHWHLTKAPRLDTNSEVAS